MITDPAAATQSQNQPAPADPGFEVAAQAFWEKNRLLILGLCAAALLAIVGREAWQYFAAQHEQDVRADYAKVADRPEQLAAFARANSGHALAGVAYLRVADEKYTAEDYRQAGENYAKAAASLQNVALLGRAKLGAAMSQLNGGDKAAGEAALKAINADAALSKNVRAEAAYHLASLAYDAGNGAEVTRIVAELGKLDATGVWAQRSTVLLTAKP